MKKLFRILLLTFALTGIAEAGVPNIFATMPTGNVSASTLDANFAYLLSTGTCIQVGNGLGGFSCMTLGANLTYTGSTLAAAQTTGPVTATTAYFMGVKLLNSATAPTIASGFGTSPSIVNSNGTASFSVNVGTGGTASSGVITMPAASTNWNCSVVNPLSGAGAFTQQSAHSSTSVTLTNYTIATDVALAWTASYVIELNCSAK